MKSRTINKSRLLPRLSLWFWSFVLLILSALNHQSFANSLDQGTLNTLYTYKFGKFTHWPDSKLNTASKKFQLCILGQNPFPQSALNLIIGKTVQGIPLSVAFFESGLIAKEALSNCHLLFISQSEKHRLSTVLAGLKHSPVLTISNIAQFSHQGGMVTLLEKQGKLNFQINSQALQQAGISISSKIMELAEIIDIGGK